MDSNSRHSHSQFVEHSFRRLTLFIQQQNALDAAASISHSNQTSQLPLANEKDQNDRIPRQTSIVTTAQHNQPPIARRTYMRPPKSRAVLTIRSESEQLFDSPHNLPDRSSESSSSSSSPPSSVRQPPIELPVHVPQEQSLYDTMFETDRRNDVRRKYNIPPPFQRTWLREPRYVPQERPLVGQIKQSHQQ